MRDSGQVVIRPNLSILLGMNKCLPEPDQYQLLFQADRHRDSAPASQQLVQIDAMAHLELSSVHPILTQVHSAAET
jgi:hypothetical protein